MCFATVLPVKRELLQLLIVFVCVCVCVCVCLTAVSKSCQVSKSLLLIDRESNVLACTIK